MHNILSDMDLQTRPLKPAETRFHFLAMTSSPAGRCLCRLAGAAPNKAHPGIARFSAFHSRISVQRPPRATHNARRIAMVSGAEDNTHFPVEHQMSYA